MGLSPRMALSAFYDNYFVQAYLTGKRPATVELYKQSMEYWIKLTPDPSIADITQLVTSEFLRKLLLSRSFKGGAALAPRTVRHHVDRLNAILSATGPSSRENEDAAGVVPRAAWISTRNITIPQCLPAGDYTPAEVALMLRGAAKMRPTRYVTELTSRTFWTLFVAGSFYLGEHRDEMMSIKLAHIDGDHVNVPPRKKTGKPNRKLLHPTVAQMIKATLSERDFLLPWKDWANPEWKTSRNSRRQFDARFQHLLAISGIPTDRRRLGTRGFRKAHLSTLAEQSFEDAQLSANHADLAVTLGYYVSGLVQNKKKQRQLDDAIGRLPDLGTGEE